MKKNKFFNKFKNLTIVNRITLMYSSVVTMILIISTAIAIYCVPLVYQNVISHEIIEATDRVCIYLNHTHNPTEEGIKEAISDGYVEFIITDCSTGEVYEYIQGQSVIEYDIINSMSVKTNSGFVDTGNKRMVFDITTDFEGVYHLVTKRHYYTYDREYIMLVSKPMVSIQTFWEWFGLRLGAIVVVCIIIAFIAGWYLSAALLKPVNEIRRTAQSIAANNDLSKRLVIDGPDDELKELSETFNYMLDRLEESFENQKRFTSDVSHELKTPIAVINGYVNLIDRWGKSDPEVLNESIASIKDEIRSMSELIKKLLLIARFDQKRISFDMEKISVNDITEKVVKDYSVVETGRKITYTPEDNVCIIGDEMQLEQLLRIFIDNAIKYSGENCEIDIRIYKDKTYGYIAVKDNGIGIAKEDLPYVFDRFFRADKSRNKTIEGTGLGLSIATHIVQAHDGKIWVESEKNKGSVFTAGFKIWNEI